MRNLYVPNLGSLIFCISRNIGPEHNYISPQEPALPEVTLIDVLTNNNKPTKVNTNVNKGFNTFFIA